MKQKIKKLPVTEEDWTRAQIIAALHDKNISLVSLARAHGLAGSSSMSIALSRSYPVGEQRIAAALHVHPKFLWPSRYNLDGTHINFNRRFPAYSLHQPVLMNKVKQTKIGILNPGETK